MRPGPAAATLAADGGRAGRSCRWRWGQRTSGRACRRLFVVPHLAVGAALFATLHAGCSLAALRGRPWPTPGARSRGPGRSRPPRTAAAPCARTSRSTKPRIIELLLVTTMPRWSSPQRGMAGLWLMAAEHARRLARRRRRQRAQLYLDRDIDELMGRTRRRPLPRHAWPPRSALVFGVGLSVALIRLAGGEVNLLRAVLAASAIGFYVFVYTRWLKRSDAAEHRHRRRGRLRPAAGGLGRGDRRRSPAGDATCSRSCSSGRRRTSGRWPCAIAASTRAPACPCCPSSGRGGDAPPDRALHAVAAGGHPGRLFLPPAWACSTWGGAGARRACSSTTRCGCSRNARPTAGPPSPSIGTRSATWP